jgi:predicted nucleic acid-binding Zn ribbon protein
MITSVLRQNGLAFDKTCVQGGKSLEFLKKGYQTKKIEMIIMLLLFALPFILYLPKHTGLDEKQRKVFFVILAVLFVSILYLWFTIEPFPYHSGIVQAITGAP